MDKPPQYDPSWAEQFRDLADYIRVFLYVTLAFVAGMIGHVFRALEARRKVVCWRVLVEGFGSGFTGLLMLFLCDFFKFPKELTGVLVGTFGWLGATLTIRVLEKWAYKKLGIDFRIESVEPRQERSDDNPTQ